MTQSPAHSSPPPRAQTLSVVIPARNAEHTLQACIRAVLANSVAADTVIVVDDGSSDRTADVVRAFADSSPVLLVQRAVSGGAATARNDGARAVSSDIILFLDADTEAKPDLIETVLERLASSGADAVCGVYDPIPLNPGLAPAYKAMFDSYQFSKRGVTRYDGFSGSCGAVRTLAFREVGGFDATLGHSGEYENEEFGYRLSLAHVTLLDPSVRVQHHFPQLIRGTRNYFVRVSQWVQLFMRRGQFETAGDATSGGAVAAISAALTLMATGLFVAGSTVGFARPTGIALVCVGTVWLLSNGGLFRHVMRTAPTFLPAALLLNLYFGTVITAGAVYGLLMGLPTLLTRKASRHGNHRT